MVECDSHEEAVNRANAVRASKGLPPLAALPSLLSEPVGE